MNTRADALDFLRIGPGFCKLKINKNQNVLTTAMLITQSHRLSQGAKNIFLVASFGSANRLGWKLWITWGLDYVLCGQKFLGCMV